MQGQADLLELIGTLDASGRLRAACTAGSRSEMRIPMIVMTTKSSTNVNAFARLDGYMMAFLKCQ